MATIASLVVNIAADTADLQRNVQRGTATLTKFAGGFESMARRAATAGAFIGTMAANLARDMARFLIRSIDDFIDRGQQLAGVGDAFRGLAGAIGGTGPALAAMRAGTQGLVADLDLLLAGNKALLLGLPVTAEDLGTLAETAVVLGRAMGLGPTQAFNDLVTALGRSSPLILDNLGLTVKVGQANTVYAKELGKTVAELTDIEKKTAFYNAAMDSARAKTAAMGEIQLTLADRIRQGTTSLTNFLDRLSAGIQQSPVFAAAMTALGAGLAMTFGATQQERITRTVQLLERVAIGLTNVGAVAIESARFMINAWALVKLAVLGLIAAMAGWLQQLVEQITLVALLGSKLPGIGAMFLALAASVAQVRQSVEAYRLSFEDQTAEVLEDSARQNAALDSLRETLRRMRAAMEQAATATDSGTAAMARQATAASTLAAAIMAIPQAPVTMGLFGRPVGLPPGPPLNGQPNIVSVGNRVRRRNPFASPRPLSIQTADRGFGSRFHDVTGRPVSGPFVSVRGGGGFGGGGGTSIVINIQRGAIVLTNPIVRDRQSLRQLEEMVAQAVTNALRARGVRFQ